MPNYYSYISNNISAHVYQFTKGSRQKQQLQIPASVTSDKIFKISQTNLLSLDKIIILNLYVVSWQFFVRIMKLLTTAIGAIDTNFDLLSRGNLNKQFHEKNADWRQDFRS